jgi:uncharacterized protein (TIGR02444 family)
MPKENEAPDDEALWRFSLAFYERPGVARTLVALQDRDGLDVNLMLFALWLGVSGHGRLTSDGLAAAERAIETVRTEIIEPLRALRRKLRHHSDKDVQHLREGVKALEREGEKAGSPCRACSVVVRHSVAARPFRRRLGQSRTLSGAGKGRQQ